MHQIPNKERKKASPRQKKPETGNKEKREKEKKERKTGKKFRIREAISLFNYYNYSAMEQQCKLRFLQQNKMI